MGGRLGMPSALGMGGRTGGLMPGPAKEEEEEEEEEGGGGMGVSPLLFISPLPFAGAAVVAIAAAGADADADAGEGDLAVAVPFRSASFACLAAFLLATRSLKDILGCFSRAGLRPGPSLRPMTGNLGPDDAAFGSGMPRRPLILVALEKGNYTVRTGVYTDATQLFAAVR
jgi:hypothetical protein